jgi:hypothetical protein
VDNQRTEPLLKTLSPETASKLLFGFRNLSGGKITHSMLMQRIDDEQEFWTQRFGMTSDQMKNKVNQLLGVPNSEL